MPIIHSLKYSDHILSLGRLNMRASQVVLVVKNLPAKAGDKTAGSIPGLEDPLEEGMATHSSTLA